MVRGRKGAKSIKDMDEEDGEGMPTKPQRIMGTVDSLGATYGFISGDDEVRRFFHAAAVFDGGYQMLRIGDRVSFLAVDSHPKGPRAIAVKMAARVSSRGGGRRA